ncbi:unannotated protein [freshwater metagenome]|uniref:Unannotated protein n=1 Tax=freshwater metagenome TaxID=449393 RepID=A0A6J6C5X6_9ZZZZ
MLAEFTLTGRNGKELLRLFHRQFIRRQIHRHVGTLQFAFGFAFEVRTEFADAQINSQAGISNGKSGVIARINFAQITGQGLQTDQVITAEIEATQPLLHIRIA